MAPPEIYVNEELLLSLDLIEQVARKHQLPVELVQAMVGIESSGDTWAWNPEPKFCWFWDARRDQPFRPLRAFESADESPPQDFNCLAGDRDQEWWAQQASWGLLQIMGATARQMGCREHFLTALCDPEVGLEFGCRYLKNRWDKYYAGYGMPAVIAAYNAGTPVRAGPNGYINQSYVNKVLASAARWKEGNAET